MAIALDHVLRAGLADGVDQAAEVLGRFRSGDRASPARRPAPDCIGRDPSHMGKLRSIRNLVKSRHRGPPTDARSRIGDADRNTAGRRFWTRMTCSTGAPSPIVFVVSD